MHKNNSLKHIIKIFEIIKIGNFEHKQSQVIQSNFARAKINNFF